MFDCVVEVHQHQLNVERACGAAGSGSQSSPESFNWKFTEYILKTVYLTTKGVPWNQHIVVG